ncbi:MAG: RusA family crossover junction endodeoxyribonuclease [Acidobacteriota bacterium]|nr:RusA family crossover junction endodeoxyribonuclease [Acidobacteriota bacterium]
MPNSESDVTLTRDGVLRFKGEAEPDPWWAQGQPIPNSQRYKKKKRTEYQRWKDCIRAAVKAKCEEVGAKWTSSDRYAVTLHFRFCQRPYPPHEPDLDNCVKPVLDGLKEGLGVDDRKFRTLLIRHLYVNSKEEEGVCIFVSTADSPANTEATGQSGRDYLR